MKPQMWKSYKVRLVMYCLDDCDASLFVISDDCLLLAVYNVCVCEQHEGLAWEQRLSLYGQVVQLLSTIVATHKGGAILLLEADYCSMEVNHQPPKFSFTIWY